MDLTAERPARQPMNERSPLTTTKDLHAMKGVQTASDSSRVVRAMACVAVRG